MYEKQMSVQSHGQTTTWMRVWVRQEMIAVIALLAITSFLAFYNLQYNPRTWQDEGGTLTLAQALSEDGVYGNPSVGGYQYFGYVQSAGPTIVVPIALSFRLFGVGLLQGRVVMVVYLLLTVALFYVVGRCLFGPRSAFVASVLLLGSPSAQLLHFGRQALGEVPALGFLLAGWLAWSYGVRSGRRWLYGLAGMLIGAAMVTKMQYIPIGFGTLVLLMVLDMLFYRQRNISALLLISAVALGCLTLWWGWQLAYFGQAIFNENLAKMRELSASSTGFDPRVSAQTIRLLLSSDTGHFYYFWGFAALCYMGILSFRRTTESLILAFLVIFVALWMAYLIFWTLPWAHYMLPLAALAALFVAKLWHDLTDGFDLSLPALWKDLRRLQMSGKLQSAMMLLVVAIILLYSLQGIVRSEVLAQDRSASQVAEFLNKTVDRSAVIETWERELGILTDHKYHFPDQSLLARTHATLYHGAPKDYVLGASYFLQYRPTYLVTGWYTRAAGIYDSEFLAKHGHLVATIGDGEQRYEVYKLDLPK